MAYYNKKEQLLFTLQTINKSEYKNNIEIIIVDDGSDENENLTHFKNDLVMPVKVIRINNNEKNYINPCVAYNIGIKNATGDIIILQNAEVCHIGDVIKYVIENIKFNDYLSFSCYGLASHEKTIEMINQYNNNNITSYINTLINKIGGNALFSNDIGGWLNHKDYHCVAYHYLSAIYKNKLEEIGCFDTDYAMGLCHDDDDFIRRIWKYGININVINEPMGIHQWHEPTVRHYDKKLWHVNNNIFTKKLSYKNIPSTFPIPINYNKKELFYDNIPKIFNCYWYGNQFSYLNYLCLETFIFYNPDWTINLYRPKNSEHKLVTWWSTEQKTQYTGINYYQYIDKLPINIIDIDFNEIGFFQDASDVHKSDYLRWYLLYNFGGLWSDLDILYTKPITKIYNNNITPDVGIFYFDHVFPIGFLFSTPKHDMFKQLLDNSIKYYDKNEYQCIGAVLWRNLWGTSEKLLKQYNNITILDKNIIYPYRWNEDTHLFYEKNVDWLTHDVIGIHWYNGGVNAKKYCSENDFNKLDTTINLLIKHFSFIKLNKYFIDFIDYDFYPFKKLENNCVNVNDFQSSKNLCSSSILYSAFDTCGNVYYKTDNFNIVDDFNNLSKYSGLYIKKSIKYNFSKKNINIYVGLSGVGKSYSTQNFTPCLKYDEVYDYKTKNFLENDIYKFFLNNITFNDFYMDGHELYSDQDLSFLKNILESFNIHIINVTVCHCNLSTIISNQNNYKKVKPATEIQLTEYYKYIYNTANDLLKRNIINNVFYFNTYTNKLDSFDSLEGFIKNLL